MQVDNEEYIAYRPDDYKHSYEGISKLEEEFADEKVLPNFKWDQFMNEYNSLVPSDISFKRVKRDDEDAPEEAPPPAEEAPGGGGGGGAEPGGSEPKLYLTPVIGITVFFAIVLAVGPFFVRKGPNRGIIQCSIMIAAFCMWLFWVTVYIGQMNPLMGPRLENTTVAWIAFKLGNPVKPAAETAAGEE